MRESRYQRRVAIACLILLLTGFLAIVFYTADAPRANHKPDSTREQVD